MNAAALAAALAAAPVPSAPAERPVDTEDVGVVEREETDPTVFPDPKKFARGFFAEGATGPAVPIGPTSEFLSVGYSLSLRMGYEIRRWIAAQAHVSANLSKYDDGVLRNELFQQYFYMGEVRFGIPIRRFLIAIQGGAGLYQHNNNLLQIAGVVDSNARFGFAYDGSLAFDVHSLSRHFSGGLLATYAGVPLLRNAGTLMIQLYLRYTL